MRVLSIIHYPEFIGPHNSNMRVIPLLREQGIDIVVVLPDEPGNAAERMRAAGVEVLTIPLHRVRARLNPRVQAGLIFGLWSEVRALRRIIRQRKIDVVMLNAMIHPHGAIAARLERVPILWQLIDEIPPWWLRRLMMPVVVRAAECVMTTGMYTARMHPGAASLGPRLLPFFPPVDTRTYRADPAVRAAARAELGFGSEDIVIGNVANIAPYKDHLTFLRAAKLLRSRFPQARFAILGHCQTRFMDYLSAVRREADSLGLSEGRDVIIRDPGARVAQLAQALDLFWLSSETEGAPTVLCEAMSLGLPVVATRAGSVPEMIEDGRNGLLVPIRDPKAIAEATARILGAPELRAALSTQARRTVVEKFDVTVCADLHARAIRMAFERGRDLGSDSAAKAKPPAAVPSRGGREAD
jgi:glycosyltransferase involved in cell wall biosynthesis